MTPDPRPDPDLDPDQEERVRRLLADARHDGPVPGDVAARIEEVLRRLAEEEPVRTASPVVDLGARRRRRRGSVLLAAAAAAVAVAVVAPRAGDLAGEEGPAAGQAESSDAGSSTSSGGESEPAPADGRVDGARPLVIGDDDFARTARRLATRVSLTRQYAQGGAPAPTEDRTDVEPASPHTCEPGRYGPGRLVAARYDGGPAVLAVRPRSGDRRVVELLRCGSGEVLRSVSVRIR